MDLPARRRGPAGRGGALGLALGRRLAPGRMLGLGRALVLDRVRLLDCVRVLDRVRLLDRVLVLGRVPMLGRTRVLGRMHALGRVFGLALALGACGGGAEAPRSVLFVTVDTLRRDAVGFHGRAPSPTPVLDALAREAVVLEDAYTVAPITLPAHASLLSGLYPASHGVRDNGAARVPGPVETLAERFRARGYRTLASVAAFVLDPCFGLDQGFERYDAPPRRLGVEVNVVQVRADRAVDALLDGLDALEKDAPFFAWLHLYDPHAPYDAPGASRALAKTAAYLEEVRYADREIGRLFDALRARGLFDELLIVVTSDHGEGLDDGPEPTHGFFVHDPTMRVPLIVRAPGLEPARVAFPTSLVDVAPTVLALARVPAEAGAFDGLDLSAALAGGAPPPERPLWIESHLPWISHGWAPSEGGLFGARKVIRSARVEAYDRARDPGEEHNLAADGPSAEDAARLAAIDEALRALERRFERESADVGALEAGALEALGYAGGGSALGVEGRPPFEALPDAYAMRPLIERLDALHEAAATGDVAGAIEDLRALIAQDAQNAVLLERLGEMLLYAGPHNREEAEGVLERALALRPGRARVHLNLATCAHLAGDGARAERELRAALALEPGLPLALYNLSLALSERADRTAAIAERRALYAEARDLLDRLLAGLAAEDPGRAEIEQARAYVASRAAG